MSESPVSEHGRIDLRDGTWEDLGPDGRWQPSTDTRVRALVILSVVAVAMLLTGLVLSVGDDDEPEEVAASTTTTAVVTTTTAAADPSSVGGRPASPRCRTDDRGAAPLRDRQLSTLLVLNAAEKTGHAGVATDRLASLGYSVLVPDNADGQAETVIFYRDGFCAEGERLADDLGYPVAQIGRLEEADLSVIPGRARMVVVLGIDSA